jgi:CubicO group peptidase (beta-lactamase class C family)
LKKLISISNDIVDRTGFSRVFFSMPDWRILILALTIAATWPTSISAEEKSGAVNLPEIDFAQAITVAGSMPRLYSILVSWHGELQLEKYFNNSGPDKLVNIKSVSKSIVSALVGIAIAQGTLQIDQTIDAYFNELLKADEDKRKAQITIADLLSMQSGLETTSNRNYGAWTKSRDWTGYALKQPMTSPAGIIMQYSTGNTHLLSAIITQATGKNTLQFAREVLSEPMGFHLPPWPRDPQGIYFGGNDMEMTARQMLMFGQLYLNEGQYNGKQIVPAEWVKQSLLKHARSLREHGRYYGYGWWIRNMAGYDVAYAWGYGGQFIILVPDLELVVVATSSSTPDNNRRGHRREVQDLVESLIIPAVAEAHRRFHRHQSTVSLE